MHNRTENKLKYSFTLHCRILENFALFAGLIGCYSFAWVTILFVFFSVFEQTEKSNILLVYLFIFCAIPNFIPQSWGQLSLNLSINNSFYIAWCASTKWVELFRFGRYCDVVFSEHLCNIACILFRSSLDVSREVFALFKRNIYFSFSSNLLSQVSF